MSLLIALGLAMLAPEMAPVRRGSSAELWENACHFQDWGQVLGGHGNVYKPREGWFVYEIQDMHGSDLYRVPEAEVLADFDQVVEKLRAAEENPNIPPHVRAGFQRWFNCPDESRRDAEGLLSDIWNAYLDHLKTDLPEVYFLVKSEEWLVEVRWARSKWYWASIVFEWLFLSSLVLVAARPMLHNKGWRSWAIHLGTLPMLFMMPAYLGYGTFTFTSAFPRGCGVLYPRLLTTLHGGTCNQLDREMLAYVPQVLEPLSTPIGMPMAISGRGMPGPTTMAIAGVIVALVVFAIHKLSARLDSSSHGTGAAGGTP